MQQQLPPFLRIRTAEDLNSIVPDAPDAAALSNFLLDSNGTRKGKQTNAEQNLDNLRVYHKSIEGGVSILLRIGEATTGDGVQLFPTHVAAPSDVIHVLDDFSLRKAPVSDFPNSQLAEASQITLPANARGISFRVAEFPYFALDLKKCFPEGCCCHAGETDTAGENQLKNLGPGSSGTPLFLQGAQGAQLIGLLSGCLLENPSVLIFINVPAVYHVGLQLFNYANETEAFRARDWVDPADVGSLCFTLDMSKVVLWDFDIYDNFVTALSEAKDPNQCKNVLWAAGGKEMSGELDRSIQLGSNILEQRVTKFGGEYLKVDDRWKALHDPTKSQIAKLVNLPRGMNFYATVLQDCDDYKIVTSLSKEHTRIFWGATSVRWLCNNEEVKIPGFERWLLLFSNIIGHDVGALQLQKCKSQTHAETLSMRWILWKTAQLLFDSDFKTKRGGRSLRVEAVWMMDQSPAATFPCEGCHKAYAKFSEAMKKLGVNVLHNGHKTWWF